MNNVDIEALRGSLQRLRGHGAGDNPEGLREVESLLPTFIRHDNGYVREKAREVRGAFEVVFSPAKWQSGGRTEAGSLRDLDMTIAKLCQALSSFG